jgi:hypothetical protein
LEEGKRGVAGRVKEEEEEEVKKGDGGTGEEEGDGVGKEVAGEKGADSKTRGEHEVEKAEEFGALVVLGEVGDEGIDGGEVDAGEACDEIADIEVDNGVGHDTNSAGEVAEGVAEIGEEEDFFAADFIGEVAEDGSCDDLSKGVGGEEKAHENVAELGGGGRRKERVGGIEKK